MKFQVTRCESMPIIDENDQSLDKHLMNQVSNKFFSERGFISDVHGWSWLLWRKDEIESWWRTFEEIINHPLGRKLSNSACDQHEMMITNINPDFGRFFVKKKKIDYIKKYWKSNGWGEPDFSDNTIKFGGLSPIFSGFFQASLEWFAEKRIKVTWQDVNSELISLNVEDSGSNIPPPDLSIGKYISERQLQIDLETGWRIDGQRHHLLPTGLFSRLQKSCSGFAANIGEDERFGWPEMDDISIAMAIAARKNFILGEELFLAADENGWMSNIKSIFSKKGLGNPTSVKYIDGNGGVLVKFETYPNIPILLGSLSGAWTRCEGRPAKINFQERNNILEITIESKQNIA